MWPESDSHDFSENSSVCSSTIVHEPEGQSVPSELNKVHCVLWEHIHPNGTKMYDSSAVKVTSSFFMDVSVLKIKIL